MLSQAAKIAAVSSCLTQYFVPKRLHLRCPKILKSRGGEQGKYLAVKQ